MENCPNCNANLVKTGMFKKNAELLPISKTKFINEFTENKSERHCTHCGDSLYNEALTIYTKEKKQLNTYILNNIGKIPIVTVYNPQGWNYKVLSLISAQSTTGTGVITDFTSSFTDFFGAKSGRHNKKLKVGENNCLNQLRLETIKIGGNAVIGTDIDYSEIGSGKGILMVCMAGTAVTVENGGKFDNDLFEAINKLNANYKRLKYLQSLEITSEYI